MKARRMQIGSAVLALAVLLGVGAQAEVRVSGLVIEGQIEGENITFDLGMRVDPEERNSEFPLVAGDVAYLEGRLPRGSELLRKDNRYLLKLRSSWRQSVNFRFAARPEKEGEWRRTWFEVPSASIRKLSLLCDRDDLEVQFPGALDVKRGKAPNGKTQVTAYLGLTNRFEVAWKPEIKRLEGELVVSCDANTLATASVGALRLDQVFTYRVIQGELNRLVLALPGVSITQVRGVDIQDWRIDPAGTNGPARLVVTLSRPHEDLYRLQVQSEMVLPKFPCEFALPVLTPEDVIRTSGFMMIGTDSAIKLQVAKMAGLTQMDPAAFPAVQSVDGEKTRRTMPARNASAYQFANMPYAADMSADDVVPTISADSRHVLALAENELSFQSSLELDVRDAPLREITLETAALPGWTVTGVTGQHAAEADVDIRENGAVRTIEIPFKQAVSGVTLIQVQMEKTLTPGEESFDLPGVKVRNARAERGYLVAAAEKGMRLRATKSGGLREVHTGSAPMRVENAQLAFRFKDPSWSASFSLERTVPSVHSEVFHVVSLGEGVLYSSAAISYHIGGAPLQELQLLIPEEIQNVELTGSEIEGWTRSNDVCTVRLQSRVLGDYTLLVTHDRQYTMPTAELDVGTIETMGTESEVGFIAIASSLSLKLDDATPPAASIIVIDREELPPEYATLVTAPILRSYRYTRTPHLARLNVQMLDTEQLLGQVADYVKLSTVLSGEGEAVTTALYFIKNAVRQFFAFDLPAGAKVWSIKSVSEDGSKQNLLSQQTGQTVLVPVDRPRDPNTALRIEVTYAQPCGKPGFWRGGVLGIKLRGPDLPESHATFAAWRLEAPAEYTIVDVDGNMTPTAASFGGWVRWTFRKAGRLVGAVLDGWGRTTVASALTADRHGGRTVDLIRTVNLKGMAAPQVNLRIVPDWIGRSGSVRVLMLAGVIGLVLLLAGQITGMLSVRAAAWTAVIAALGQCSVGRSVLAFALLALAVYLLVLLVMRAWRMGVFRFIGWVLFAPFRGLRAIFRWIFSGRRKRAEAAVDDDLPFEPAPGPDPDASSPPPLPPATPDDGRSGGAAVGLLLIGCLLSAFAVHAWSAEKAAPKKAVPPAPPPTPAMDAVSLQIDGPHSGRDVEQSARIVAEYEFRLDEPGRYLIAPRGCVLKQTDLGSDDLEIRATETGYMLEVLRGGRYKASVEIQAPVQSKDGRSILYLPMPPALRSQATLRIPEADLDVQSDAAVLLRTKPTEKATEAEAVFGIGRVPAFSWRPRVRRTTLEDSVFYCTVDTLATLQPGVVEVANIVSFQIAQGELRQFTLSIPAGMNVTAVQGDEIATWSFDPGTQKLNVALEKGISGHYRLTVAGQVTCDGMPYSVKAGVPVVEESARQRGAFAFAATETVQVRVDETEALNPMNIEDFPLKTFVAGEQRGRRPASVRKAYRYNQPAKVTAAVSAERVLPEIRVTESGSVSVSDERTVLATKLGLRIAKAGVFSVKLDIPEGFDVESLTGKDVSHWDESKENGGGVVVYFGRQVTDATEMDLVVSRTEKGIEPVIAVPRIGVQDARKHNGRLVVSGERGLRMMIAEHTGVDLKKAAEEGIKQAGVLVFEILRPAWSVSLRTEVLTPVIKPEVLQVVDLTEGMLLCRAYLRYAIENAGVKSFRLRSPAPGVTLSVAGRNIARVQEVDKETGLWQVDLHGKVENLYTMTVNYQLPYDRASQRVTIAPLQTEGTDALRGYLVVSCGGRVQIEPEEDVMGLKVEDPRNVPPVFGAGDLSGAVRCYRIVQADWDLPLSVVRHETAEVLPASVQQVRMTSVLSEDGKTLTRALLQMDVGSLRLLKFQLPRSEDVLWTALVNGGEVAISRDGALYCVPLEEQAAGQITLVDLVYSGSSTAGMFSRRQKYEAPRFAGLPLKDIEWSFYVLPQLRYHGFGGTMEQREDQPAVVQTYGADQYWAWNNDRRTEALEKAREGLNVGEQLLKSGNQKGAMQAFQYAMDNSQAEAELNEDARVQLRNLQKQQVKVNLYQRRGAMRSARNIVDEAQQQGVQINAQTQLPQAAQTVDRLLGEKEKTALEAVADRLIDQQAAAAGVVRTINVTVPEHGKLLQFYRPMLINPSDELSVTFKTSAGFVRSTMLRFWPLGLLFVGLWIVLAVRRKTEQG